MGCRGTRALMAAGLSLFLLGGCSTSPESLSVANSPAQQGGHVEGVLARSPSGAIALLDLPLPAGYSALGGATVRVLGSEAVATTAPDGHLDLPLAQRRARLLVKTESGSSVLDAPVFASDAGPAVVLEHFPSHLALREGESAAVRAVGVDEQGRYIPVRASQQVRAAVETPEVPHTTSLAARPLLQSAPAPGGPGQAEIVSSAGALEGTAPLSTYSQPCLAMLSGQVLDQQGQPIAGAVVQVEGTTATASTDASGFYQLDGLPPLPSRVAVVANNQQVALGFAPLTSRLLTRLNLVARATSYEPGPVLPVAGATALAVRPNRAVYVGQGASLSEFTSAGQSVTAPSLPGLQSIVGLAADFSGEAYLADAGAGTLVPASNPDTPLPLPSPLAMTVDSGANLVALAQGEDGIFYSANLSTRSWTEPRELGDGLLDQPTALAASPDGTFVVCDAGKDQVAVLGVSQAGRALHGDPNPASPDTLRASLLRSWPVEDPKGIAVGANGEVYVSSARGVVCTDAQGNDPIVVSSNPALGPLAVDHLGSVWVAEDDGVHGYLPQAVAAPLAQLPAPSGQSLVEGPSLATLDQGLQDAMRQFGFVGATVAVSVNGRLVLSRGYGYSELDLSAQTPAQPDMLFRLASCSKIFTGATALLQLQDYPSSFTPELKPFSNGGLLAGAVSGYDLSANGFADARMADISILSLLQMTAGLDTPGALYSPLARTLGGASPPATAIEILLYTFSTDRLARTPGSGFVYSDVAYMTLGRVIEAVAKSQGLDQSYATVVRNRLLAPLGITDMRIADTRLGGAAPNEVCYYPFTGQTCGQSIFTNQPSQVPTTYGASYDGVSHDSTGGWIASATDLVIMANALSPNGAPPGFSNPLDSTRQALFAALPTFSGANPGNYYGAGGWFLTAGSDGQVTKMTKDGGLPGTTTYVEYQLQGGDQVVFAYLLNSRAGPGAKRSSQARALFQAPLEAFIAAQNGQWPAGNLWK